MHLANALQNVIVQALGAANRRSMYVALARFSPFSSLCVYSLLPCARKTVTGVDRDAIHEKQSR